MPAPADREKALETALAQIDRQFGKGSVMRLGEDSRPPIEVIPTGSIALDVALGIGGLPRGRVVEIFGPESSGKTTVALHAVVRGTVTGSFENRPFADAMKELAYQTGASITLDPRAGDKLNTRVSTPSPMVWRCMLHWSCWQTWPIWKWWYWATASTSPRPSMPGVWKRSRSGSEEPSRCPARKMTTNGNCLAPAADCPVCRPIFDR